MRPRGCAPPGHTAHEALSLAYGIALESPLLEGFGTYLPGSIRGVGGNGRGKTGNPDLFGEGVSAPEAQMAIAAAMKHGLQTRDAELTLARTLGELA
jgi:hypothetical protein